MRAQDGGIGGATALGSGVIDKDYGLVSFGNIFIASATCKASKINQQELNVDPTCSLLTRDSAD